MPAWDPQTTNVPYLAWVGEEIRLNKCIADDGVSAATDLSGVSADFLVEDWGGTSTVLPQIEPSTVRVYYSSDFDGGAGGVCFEGDIVSLFPGIARVELDVTDPGGVLGLSSDMSADPVLKHQFLTAWMTYNTPTLTRLSAGDFAASAQKEAALELGDSTTAGMFNAGGGSGYLDVMVTGSIPLNADWAAYLGEPVVTLPNDWPLLAKTLASTSDPNYQADPWATWNTSGQDSSDLADPGVSNGATLGELNTGIPPAPCSPVPVQFASIPYGPHYVDDCTGGGDTGPFGTVFGTLSSDTSVGPFDPLDPADTLLPSSNTVPTAADAPMPPARIDVALGLNSGGATDITGVGSLQPADKDKTYSRDFLGSPANTTPYNEYAPFYDAYIPATSRPSDATSGIDGGIGNNFPGFLVDGEYHFWDFAATEGSNVGSATNCLRFAPDDNPQQDSPQTHPGDYYQTPSGPTMVSLYTDQHGEAQVRWVPGEGFYFNSLITSTGGSILNADGGCDLQSLYGVAGGLGSATVTATAVYPFKPVDYPSMTSGPVTESATSLWSKSLTAFPKGTGAANSTSQIVVAHAQDIDGTPFAGETVCFDTDAEGITYFGGTVGGINLAGSSPTSDSANPGLGRMCVITNAQGNAAVEVLESETKTVNVEADFTNEGILRSIMLTYPATGTTSTGPTTGPTSPGSTSSPAPATTKTAGGSTVTSSTTTIIVNVGGAGGSQTGSQTSTKAGTPFVSPATKVTSTKALKLRSRVRIVHVQTPLTGKHFLVVRVTNSTARTVNIRVLLVRNGRAKWVTYTVRTNRNVKIALGSSVSRIKKVVLG
jgi:hypothetical protein